MEVALEERSAAEGSLLTNGAGAHWTSRGGKLHVLVGLWINHVLEVQNQDFSLIRKLVESLGEVLAECVVLDFESNGTLILSSIIDVHRHSNTSLNGCLCRNSAGWHSSFCLELVDLSATDLGSQGNWI
jgi:hypothetical protein